MNDNDKTSGLVIVYTGNGKGKTTAALGLCLRAVGWGEKVCIIQFLKSEEYACGEKICLKNMGVEIHTTGIGFSWKKDAQQQRASLVDAWELALQKLKDTTIDLLVLDEINCVLDISHFETQDIVNEIQVIEALKNRAEGMTVVLTGRGAKKGIIDFSDLTTEMKEIKHPFALGYLAIKGVDY